MAGATPDHIFLPDRAHKTCVSELGHYHYWKSISAVRYGADQMSNMPTVIEWRGNVPQAERCAQTVLFLCTLFRIVLLKANTCVYLIVPVS